MGLLKWLAGWLLSRLFRQSPPLSQEAQQAKQVGALQAELQAKVQNDHAVEAAQAAADAVRAEQLRSPDREALARAPDPYSRD